LKERIHSQTVEVINTEEVDRYKYYSLKNQAEETAV
jgi:hypothetical protein